MGTRLKLAQSAFHVPTPPARHSGGANDSLTEARRSSRQPGHPSRLPTTTTTEGLRPLLVEKTPLVGGSLALSAGVLWLPNNSLLAREGVAGWRGPALTYLAQFVEERHPVSMPPAARFCCREAAELRANGIVDSN